MIVSSRAGAEYRAMFGLTDASLAGRKVLDCCAGGSGFVAETGGFAVAVDPAYALDGDDLISRVRASLHETDAIIAAHADDFDWRTAATAPASWRCRTVSSATRTRCSS